ncbi:MAG: cyclic nucleotide-binding domain-containing protein [Deltaproteobacteria bacterium]|nr:cyclic nucleotide-binding domain-containing protein [Deltaproteobacteria bacterium]MBW2013342.1 cyclic nucleotide-binding domain-containing protein [Deltaproteobacteria bacterium]MBW2088077.1 cyclic nucleotide-binding domain-containing protein [Deltaproteobacteria bacterium]MBW2321223.1 cyclic nucleotide-binding domain-containing protein [Deltaproteobacteria bacterium]
MGNFVLAGNLSFLSLGDILQLLGSNASTGVLCITSKYAQDLGSILFSNGNPVDASVGSLTGLDAINSLFGWLEGEFEFIEKKVSNKNVIKKSRMQIILDCLRMLDDGQIEQLGPVTFTKKSSLPSDKQSNLPIIRGPLVDYTYVVDEEEVHAGNKIVGEGKHGGWLWVILEGTAEIIRETPQGPLKLLRIAEGAFIGSVSSFLLLEESVRSAAIVAVNDVLLGVLDSRRLSVAFLRMSNQFRSLAISLDRRLKQVTNIAVDIHLNNINVEKFIKGKDHVFTQGENVERLFTIAEGEAHIVRDTENGYVPLANLYPDDFFGHIPFLDIGQEPYSASVFGSKDLKITEVDPDILGKEYNQLSPTFKNFIRHIANCILVTSMVACEFQKNTVRKRPGKT